MLVNIVSIIMYRVSKRTPQTRSDFFGSPTLSDRDCSRAKASVTFLPRAKPFVRTTKKKPKQRNVGTYGRIRVRASVRASNRAGFQWFSRERSVLSARIQFRARARAQSRRRRPRESQSMCVCVRVALDDDTETTGNRTRTIRFLPYDGQSAKLDRVCPCPQG